jgi:hypothetical protein
MMLLLLQDPKQQIWRMSRLVSLMLQDGHIRSLVLLQAAQQAYASQQGAGYGGQQQASYSAQPGYGAAASPYGAAAPATSSAYGAQGQAAGMFMLRVELTTSRRHGWWCCGLRTSRNRECQRFRAALGAKGTHLGQTAGSNAGASSILFDCLQ